MHRAPTVIAGVLRNERGTSIHACNLQIPAASEQFKSKSPALLPDVWHSRAKELAMLPGFASECAISEVPLGNTDDVVRLN
jgi:hypothetical protein